MLSSIYSLLHHSSACKRRSTEIFIAIKRILHRIFFQAWNYHAIRIIWLYAAFTHNFAFCEMLTKGFVTKNSCCCLVVILTLCSYKFNDWVNSLTCNSLSVFLCYYWSTLKFKLLNPFARVYKKTRIFRSYVSPFNVTCYIPPEPSKHAILFTCILFCI